LQHVVASRGGFGARIQAESIGDLPGRAQRLGLLACRAERIGLLAGRTDRCRPSSVPVP